MYDECESWYNFYMYDIEHDIEYDILYNIINLICDTITCS